MGIMEYLSKRVCTETNDSIWTSVEVLRKALLAGLTLDWMVSESGDNSVTEYFN